MRSELLSLQQQLSILNRCFHRSGTFIEFTREEVEQSVAARFEKQVRLYPTQLAVKTRRQEITYGQLNREANQVAHAVLMRTGIGDGPIALLFEPGIPAITGILGVLKAGRAFLPLDPNFPVSRTNYMVEDVGSQLILTDSKNMSLAADLASGSCLVIDTGNLDSSLSSEDPNLPTSPYAPASVVYTSGSTGQPKGVTHNQRNFLHAVMRPCNVYHICSSDRLTMLFSPLSSSGFRDTFRALLNGATLYPLDLKNDGIGTVADWLVENQITIYRSVPTVYRQLLFGLDTETSMPDLRLLILTGEPVLQNDVALFAKHFPRSCVMVNSFGLTEVPNLGIYFIDHETQIQGSSVPVGYDFSDGIEVLILADNLAEIGKNHIGQIAIRSGYLATGYWNRPELTQAAFLDDPDDENRRIFLTGDVGRILEDGCLEHFGRMDSQVKVRGFRVELSEIENVIAGLDTVREVSVTADWPTSFNNQKLIAYFVPSGEPPPTSHALKQILSARLPDYMVPSAFISLDSLPKLPSGKIDRNALPRPSQGRPDVGTPFVTPRSVVEQVLADIWAQVLQVDQVGRDDDFLDIGGDSLSAAALLVQVEESFRKKLPLAALIQASTVAQMAEILRNERWTTSDSCLVTIQPKGGRPPFFCVHGGGGHVLGFAALSRHLGDEQPFYGLESVGRDGEQPPLTDIKDMAARYIDEIQTVQPGGPYFLGGYSMGGVIAFEMAQQLQAGGQQVPFLALLDTDCVWSISDWRMRRNVVFGEIRNSHKLLQRNPATQRRLIWEKIETYVMRTNTYSPVFNSNRGASKRYRPHPFPGKITYFWASDNPEDVSESRKGWQAMAELGVDVHTIPGNHETILREPQLRVLAERLKDCLDHALPA